MRERKLKPIPTIATKKQIFKMYYKLPDRVVRNAINIAIRKVNKTSRIKSTKHIKTLNSKHIAIICDELGDAPGYESVFNREI